MSWTSAFLFSNSSMSSGGSSGFCFLLDWISLADLPPFEWPLLYRFWEANSIFLVGLFPLLAFLGLLESAELLFFYRGDMGYG